MRLSHFKVLSFDCYGTLIDWETGIKRAASKLLERTSPEALLEAFGRNESRLESEHLTTLYPEILEDVYRAIADELGVEVTDEGCRKFGESVGDWPAFSDSGAALAKLKRRFKLAILSN